MHYAVAGIPNILIAFKEEANITARNSAKVKSLNKGLRKNIRDIRKLIEDAQRKAASVSCSKFSSRRSSSATFSNVFKSRTISIPDKASQSKGRKTMPPLILAKFIYFRIPKF